MSGVVDALWWNGVQAVITMFVIAPSAAAPSLDVTLDEAIPGQVSYFELEDEDGMIGDFHLYSYDILFKEYLPEDLAGYLGELLRRGSAAGELAWLAFEGSFDFNHLLTPDIADQIYGVCRRNEEPVVTLDKGHLRSQAWAEVIARHRAGVV
jgi:hypothetical protein